MVVDGVGFESVNANPIVLKFNRFNPKLVVTGSFLIFFVFTRTLQYLVVGRHAYHFFLLLRSIIVKRAWIVDFELDKSLVFCFLAVLNHIKMDISHCYGSIKLTLFLRPIKLLQTQNRKKQDALNYHSFTVLCCYIVY